MAGIKAMSKEEQRERYSNVWRSVDGAKFFLEKVTNAKKARDESGKHLWTEHQIADMFGMLTTDLRFHISAANWIVREDLKKQVAKLKEAGKTVREMAIIIGRNESSCRLILSELEDE